MTKLLCIDPGFDRLGYAIGTVKSHQFLPIDYGTLQTHSSQNHYSRYQKIIAFIKNLLDVHQPNVLAIESLFFTKNVTNGLKVAEVRGIIIGLCLDKNLTIYEFLPNQIKMSVTGHGSADKAGVMKMVKMQLKITDKILDDCADALAIGITCATTKL